MKYSIMDLFISAPHFSRRVISGCPWGAQPITAAEAWRLINSSYDVTVHDRNVLDFILAAVGVAV